MDLRPKLLLMTNRKLHMSFRLTPGPMILDELLYLYLYAGKYWY